MNRRRFLSVLGALVPGMALAAPPKAPRPPQAPPVRCEPPLKLNDGSYDPDHTCDRCGHTSARGTGNWIVRSDSGDRHTHKCENCGHTWWHFDDGHVPATTYTLPASSGCANGNCPTSATSYRRGLIFRR